MAEARATCLEQTRARGSRRLLSKTDKERANRSELRRASTRHHLASQMDEDKAARLLHAREGKRRGGQTDLAETTCFRQMRLRAVSESDHETDTRLESAAQLKVCARATRLCVHVRFTLHPPGASTIALPPQRQCGHFLVTVGRAPAGYPRYAKESEDFTLEKLAGSRPYQYEDAAFKTGIWCHASESVRFGSFACKK
ncbi:hypothetical protein HPB52_004179 [Rhipicephalus sanguineus]|uniref:Uncharacterized protein n=1 Tax=Rhipicephalus sanguineus TaxID=34632 RepID=A0A9D4PKM5_RHISA|nr:hypothetical protein HPB52_004179 [Rhipicephalus sanguineus]